MFYFIGSVVKIMLLFSLHKEQQTSRELKRNMNDRIIIFLTSLLIFLKLVFAIFYHFLFFHQMIALEKLWKMFFISSKKLFSFSRYSDFGNFFPSFPQVPDSKGQMEVDWFVMSSSDLHKFAYVIFGIILKNCFTLHHETWSHYI